MANFTFDELIAKREQRRQDKLLMTAITLPNSDKTLLVKKPTDSRMLHIHGKFINAVGDFEALLSCTDEALYHCCEQLQSLKLHEALEIADPLDIVPALFTITERTALGEQLFEFLGLISADENSDQSQENPIKN